MTADDFRETLVHHLKYRIGKDPSHAQLRDWRIALSHVVRDRITDRWFEATRRTYAGQHKRVYYLSMEFLIGRLLEDAIINLRLEDEARLALKDLGLSLHEVFADEPDAALGNGGLGRLAACFLESLSTIGVPAFGYGIRYEHGLFRQRFEDGRQIEEPEDWLNQPHAWEFERPEAAFLIGFGGEVRDEAGQVEWTPEETVVAEAFDTPIVGWRGRWANTLRLWSARPVHAFDLERFNRGDYTGAAEAEARARSISRVLYPDDTTDQGKLLRLAQEYFFTAASLRDLVRRYRSEYDDLSGLPGKVAVQLNDTHPAIAGPELVRILHDEQGMPFDTAMDTARSCLNYTNHTLLPEALERWSEGLMSRVLPRHMQIIARIDERHSAQNPSRKVSVLGDGEVRMGELSFIMASRVNGVSALHTGLMKTTVFKELNRLHPEKIVNETNGVTPRRWMKSCNPALSDLIYSTIGHGWVGDLELLSKLESHVSDPAFLTAYQAAKRSNKVALSNWLGEAMETAVDPDMMFDVQIKRIHEYKRQHMNILETVALWQEIRDNPNADWTPRLKIFSGKAAPGYVFAKGIIHLINDVATVLNADPVTSPFLKVVYPPNYNVTLAERLIPAADLSEQISTAGKEASGTGNMKFALNGALTIGTLDGANVEIRELVGAENFFLFGMTAEEVVARREIPGHASRAIAEDMRLARALDAIRKGVFSPVVPDCHRSIADNLSGADYFCVCSDFTDYWRAQREVDTTFRDKAAWGRMAALNTARSGWFSSDRTIRGYMADIWNIEAAETLTDIERRNANGDLDIRAV